MSTDSFIIKNGRIINDKSDLDIIGDVFVKNNVIQHVGEAINTDDYTQLVHKGNVAVFDASKCLILPGLIDIHVHAYEHATPLGINVDKYCLARGVTTVVDAGSSGACTFPGLRKFIINKCSTRLLCFLHIATHGLAAAGCSGDGNGGECDHLNQVDEIKCSTTVKESKDVIVGVKVRLSTGVTDNGKLEKEVFRRAINSAKECNVPLMVHHILSNIPVQPAKGLSDLSCPGNLSMGDIYTHSFHGHDTTIIDESLKKIHPDVLRARERGVLFDVGHGQGSFSWERARVAMESKFKPDTISTDLHTGNINGPVYDLLLVMSRFLHLGMPLNEVIGAVTFKAAKAIGKEKCLGSLEKGREADVTILKLEDCDFWLEDCHGIKENLRQILIPVAVLRGGKQYQIKDLENYPFKKK